LPAPAEGPAEFGCDLTARPRPLPHFWEHTVGSDHATMALRADWRAALCRAHDELGFRHVRFHGILSDDTGTLLCENDRLVHQFYNADNIIDYLLDIGMRPFVELSFMPSTLASGTATVFKYRGNVTPPRSYARWTTLITTLVQHWVERYGVVEVRHWFFEVWNEPNLEAFWTGSQADYFRLYDTTARAIKGIDARLKVGGPATANNAWVADFVAHCRKRRTPIDFISTHHYPTDAFGDPGDDTVTQLSKSRRSVLRDEASTVHRQAAGKPVYYTEWSSSSNPRDSLHDAPYAAAFIVKTVLEANGLVSGYSWWTFSDLFEENFFPARPFHGGFGLLTIRGVAKPSYRAFELLHRIGNAMQPVTGSHPTVDVWVIASDNSLTVICSNWALPRHPIAATQVRVTLAGARRPLAATIARIDEQHANPQRTWQQMGSPDYPSPQQLRRLHAASELTSRPQRVHYHEEQLRLSFRMPPQGVAAITVRFRQR
jgi:xylan 1,4-beta-xylosidase